MKICIKCKVEKDEALFRKKRRNKDGLNSRCKCCMREYGLNYRLNENNKEKIKKRNAIYNANNKEKAKEYRANNKEKIKKRSAIYRANNKEKAKEYKANNKEKIKKLHAIYYENNKEKIKKLHAIYNANNKEKIREREGEYRHDLVNPYIVRLIRQGTTLRSKDIPIELIEVKRMQMMINRKLKELRE